MRDEKDPNSPSHYDKFRKLLAQKIGQSEGNVHIFSVMNNGAYTDIRYAAHGSPYYPASKLDGVVSMYQAEVSLYLLLSLKLCNISHRYFIFYVTGIENLEASNFLPFYLFVYSFVSHHLRHASLYIPPT